MYYIDKMSMNSFMEWVMNRQADEFLYKILTNSIVYVFLNSPIMMEIYISDPCVDFQQFVMNFKKWVKKLMDGKNGLANRSWPNWPWPVSLVIQLILHVVYNPYHKNISKINKKSTVDSVLIALQWCYMLLLQQWRNIHKRFAINKWVEQHPRLCSLSLHCPTSCRLTILNWSRNQNVPCNFQW